MNKENDIRKIKNNRNEIEINYSKNKETKIYKITSQDKTLLDLFKEDIQTGEINNNPTYATIKEIENNDWEKTMELTIQYEHEDNIHDFEKTIITKTYPVDLQSVECPIKEIYKRIQNILKETQKIINNEANHG